MKCTLIAVVMLASCAAHLLLADLQEAEAFGNEEVQSLLQTRKVNQEDNEPVSHAKSFKAFLSSSPHFVWGQKEKRIKKWKKGIFRKAIKSFGILKIPGLKLLKFNASMIRSLKRAKKNVVIRRAPRPAVKRIRGKGDSKPQKRSLYDVCQEHVDSMYVLAHLDESLAYKVETVRCDGPCRSQTLNLELGNCVLKKKTMVVYVIDESKKLIPKTIQPGCACECLMHYL